LAENYGWLFFSLPMLFLLLALMLGKKTLDGYFGDGHL